jgi:hypothetical protein
MKTRVLMVLMEILMEVLLMEGREREDTPPDNECEGEVRVVWWW